jgi:hypothetical protein
MCKLRWRSSLKDMVPNPEPPREPPSFMVAAYSLYGHAILQYRYSNDVYLGKKALVPVWTQQMIEEMRQKVMPDIDVVARGGLPNPYGSYREAVLASHRAFQKHPIKEKHVLVVGSEDPWMEALLLAYGARKITTLENGKIDSQHPLVTTMTPSAFAESFLSDKLPVFDAIVSYSSLEHDGLGRYGDPLNPWGDLEAVRNMHCLLAKGGLFYLGIPSAARDCTVFNLHRVYGPVRRSMVFEGWNLLGTYDSSEPVEYQNAIDCNFYQPVFVLKKERDD